MNPELTTIDVNTGEVTTREMTDGEYAQLQEEQSLGNGPIVVNDETPSPN
jgi:hypothetical protein